MNKQADELEAYFSFLFFDVVVCETELGAAAAPPRSVLVLHVINLEKAVFSSEF